MSLKKFDFKMIANCFLVAALTSLSIWHGYQFYYDRITHVHINDAPTKMTLVPIDTSNKPKQQIGQSEGQQQ